MSWKQTKIGQTFVKSLAVMHVNVRHMLQKWKQCEKCKNIKKASFWLIFMKLLSHAVWHHIIYAPNYAKLYIS